MNQAEAIAALDALGVDDPEVAHVVADQILLAVAPAGVRAAYERLEKRAPWWASS